MLSVEALEKLLKDYAGRYSTGDEVSMVCIQHFRHIHLEPLVILLPHHLDTALYKHPSVVVLSDSSFFFNKKIPFVIPSFARDVSIFYVHNL